MASSHIIDLVNFSKLKEGLNKYCFRYIIHNSDEWYPFSGFCPYKVILVLLFLIFDCIAVNVKDSNILISLDCYNIIFAKYVARG